jgi:leader peptidase (prepilin peptidase)/N-methyltransferase
MFEIIALLSLFGAIATLCILSVIDLREGLLPNEYVMALAICGAMFHLSTAWHYAGLTDMALGAAIGGGFLYIVRLVANRIYKQDALGLGDVKLLMAAGIWLGPIHILMAITIGAMAGLVHGLLVAIKTKVSLNKLSLPAGPGFAAGIIIAGALQFHTIGQVLWP